MARRIFAKHRRQHSFALLDVVLCAVLLAMAIVVNVRPYRALAFSSPALPYPASFYFLIIVLLIGAIFALIPAVRLRLKTLRMQVSDDGPGAGRDETARRRGRHHGGQGIDESEIFLGRVSGPRDRQKGAC